MNKNTTDITLSAYFNDIVIGYYEELCIRDSYKTYGVEVKSGKTEGKTAQLLLKDEKVEAVYFLKGDTYGGIADRKVTVPIYLVGRMQFDFVKEHTPGSS